MLATRRSFLASLVLLGTGLDARVAQATLARGLTLDELVGRSARGVIATPLEAHCAWATFGRSDVIVTETRVRVEEALLGTAPSELLVRVLGGSIGDMGMRVDGQAELRLGKTGVLFLTPPVGERDFVVGAAQGHYPLTHAERDVARLTPSPRLPRLLKPDGSAVQRLSGRTIAEAHDLVRAVRR
jgi:hypothetical protein